jgi:dolichol-phosphate mannosyltransferase
LNQLATSTTRPGVGLAFAEEEYAVAAPVEPEDLPSPIALTVVVPTFNERENVTVLLARLETTLAGVAWEAVFVDDHSPDGTADTLRAVARVDRRVRVIERIGRRGLASACIEGMMSSAAPYIAVMDADLQHDETRLPEMLRLIKRGGIDVVVASRNLGGGSMGEFTRRRERISHLGRRISQLVCRCQLTDAMSGFFLVEASFFRAQVPRLTGSGFKILVDILATSKVVPRVVEVPYHFGMRQAGESKLDSNVKLEYLYLIVDKLVGGWVPTRFALFLGVGVLGVGVHLAVLVALYGPRRLTFVQAQMAATLVAMTSNFLMNNLATFRDRRLRGAALFLGLMKFYVACSVGAMINVAFASMLVSRGMPWLLAGVTGTAISSVWNYWVNTVLTWRRGIR